MVRQHVRRVLAWPRSQGEERLPWVVSQSWQHALFLHWRVPAEAIRPLLPPGTRLAQFEGQAWVSLVPLMMVDVRVRGLPRRSAATWPELNFRTYVEVGEHRGLAFLSIDADNRLWARAGRAWGLPTCHADMAFAHRDGWCEMRVDRAPQRRVGAARFEARWRPRGPVHEARPGSLEAFHAENELMFMAGPRRALWRARIWHPPWPLQDVEVDLGRNTVGEAIGLPLGRPDRTAYARTAETVAWAPVPAGGAA